MNFFPNLPFHSWEILYFFFFKFWYYKIHFTNFVLNFPVHCTCLWVLTINNNTHNYKQNNNKLQHNIKNNNYGNHDDNSTSWLWFWFQRNTLNLKPSLFIFLPIIISWQGCALKYG